MNKCLLNKIYTGLLIFALIIIIGGIVTALKIMEYNSVHKNRAEKSLAVYKNYTLIKQNPIPNGGNTIINSLKRINIMDCVIFSTLHPIRRIYHVVIRMILCHTMQ